MNKNKLGFYSVFICILVLLIGVCSYFLYYFYNIKDSDIDTNAVVVKENSNMTYSVNLLSEDFTNNDNIDVAFMHDVLDRIKANYSYSVTFDKRVKGDYSYSVKGYLVASTKDGEKVLNREIYNQALKKYEVDGNVINIADNFIVDFKGNYAIYRNYVDNYDISVDSYIKYKVSLHYVVYNENIKKHISETKELDFVVPVSKNVVKIETPGSEITQRKEFSELTEVVRPIYLVICGEFIGAILLCVFIIIYIVRKIIKSESLFDKRRRQLLKKYDANIVHIKELPNLKKMDVMFVENFKDLVDASNTLNLPIHYVDVVVGHEATFIIMNKKCAYVYKLSDKDLRD